MTRSEQILKYVSAGQRGIEVGPWFSPLAPKRDGYDCLVLDVFDSETVRARAAADPNISQEQAALIEDVDVVGSSTLIGDLVRQRGELNSFDYIISSHNFEHLPNPIRFLNGCAEALRPGGVLSMRLSDWIQAYLDDRDKPSLAQVFEGLTMFAHHWDGSRKRHDFCPDTPPDTIACDVEMDKIWEVWSSRIERKDSGYVCKDGSYLDAHCSVFTPASFELLIRDCGFIGLTRFVVIEVARAGAEFHAHLRPTDEPAELRPHDYPKARTALLHEIKEEAGEISAAYHRYKALSETLSQEVGVLRDSVFERDIALETAQDNIQILEQRLVHASQRISKLEKSLSWRITAPLRHVNRLVRARSLPESPW
jgi:SAM-dependent methyltransferase